MAVTLEVLRILSEQ